MNTNIIPDSTATVHGSGLPEAVTEALDQGRSIIPIQRDKKPPSGFSWKQYQDERPSGADLVSWALMYTPSAWAFITGEISSLVVLDFDGDTGLDTLLSLGLTPHVQTPGGHHVYLKHPGWRVATLNHKSSKELARQFPGMDVRGDGGYAIFAGSSVHGEYETLGSHPPYEIEELPSSLRAFLKVTVPNGGPQGEPECMNVDCTYLVRQALERVERGEGRNNSGAWLAMQLRDAQLDETAAWTIMERFVSQVPSRDAHGRQDHYREAEARATLKSAFSRPAREPWGSGSAPQAGVSEQTTVSRFIPRSVADVEADGPLAPLVDGILSRSTVNVIFGPSNGGKSFLAVDLGMSIATGTPWHGHDVHEGCVIYLAAEGKVGLPKRVRAWQDAHGGISDEKFLLITGAPQLSNENEVRELIAGLKTLPEPPAAIFIDTVAQTFGDGDENSTRDMMKYVKGAQKVQEEAESTVILVHHTGRQGEAPRGNSSLDAAMQTIIKVNPTAKGIEVACHRQKDDEEFPSKWFHLTPVGHSMVLLPSETQISARNADPVVGLSRKRREVMNALAEYGTTGATQAELVAATGLKKSTVSEALNRLEDLGLVERFRTDGQERWRTLQEAA